MKSHRVTIVKQLGGSGEHQHCGEDTPWIHGVHYRTPHTHTPSYLGPILDSPIYLLACFWEVGGNRKKAYANTGDHVTHCTLSTPSSGSNLGLWSCATVSPRINTRQIFISSSTF